MYCVERPLTRLSAIGLGGHQSGLSRTRPPPAQGGTGGGGAVAGLADERDCLRAAERIELDPAPLEEARVFPFPNLSRLRYLESSNPLVAHGARPPRTAPEALPEGEAGTPG